MSTPISPRRNCLIVCAALVLAACSETLAPAPGLDVAMHVSDQAAPVPFSNPASTQGLLCDVTFEAQALGRQAHATWLDASILFYAGPNLSVPYDSIIVAANDVRATFSADTIGPGQVEHTRWLFSVSTPIEISMNFHYRVDPGGDIKTATTYIACGGEGVAASSRRPGKMPPTVSPQRVRINAS